MRSRASAATRRSRESSGAPPSAPAPTCRTATGTPRGRRSGPGRTGWRAPSPDPRPPRSATTAKPLRATPRPPRTAPALAGWPTGLAPARDRAYRCRVVRLGATWFRRRWQGRALHAEDAGWPRKSSGLQTNCRQFPHPPGSVSSSGVRSALSRGVEPGVAMRDRPRAAVRRPEAQISPGWSLRSPLTGASGMTKNVS